MKRNTFLFFLAFGLFLFGCSSTNINSPQRVQQTCTTTPISSSESQEKQCCLKDTLVVKRAEEVCSLNDAKDSVSNASSTNVTVSPSVPLDFSRDYEFRGRFDYQKEEVVDSREGCFGANCQVNNVLVVNTKKKDLFDFFKDACQSLNDYIIEEDYLFILVSLSCFPLILLILSFLPSFKFLKNIYDVKKLPRIYKRIAQYCQCLGFYVEKILLYEFKSYNILSPSEDAENFFDETYNQLKFAIIDENKKVNNIAITGPYGAGKSSVWRTFCKKVNISRFKSVVEISLAKFNDPNEDGFLQIYNEPDVEKAIIQQLIFSKKYADLKYSNFPRIRNLTDLKTILLTMFMFALIALIVPFADEDVLCIVKAWAKNPFEIGTIYIPMTLSFIYIFIYYAIQKINKMRVSKINLKQFEVAIGNGESLFDKCINEIVYFFEATKCNCVVIEDLDRFNTLKYFTKLREINVLINNYPGIKNKVKFVYLVKDDILASEERTKFFDMIIPVVPILNGRTETIVYIKKHFLRESLNKVDKEKPYLSDTYLHKMAKYLNDLRLVKNCFNEFKVYKENATRVRGELELAKIIMQNRGELEDERIFSLVLLKNRNPREFQDLIKEKGTVFFCLNDAIVQYEKGKLDKKNGKV